MPTIEQRLDAIEAHLVARDGFKPAADPVPQPPTPTPVTPTPTPPPVTGNGDYIIPPEAKTLPAGSALIGLAPGNYALEGGEYKVNGGTLAGVHLYAATPRKVVLRATKQLIVNGGGLYGLMGDGGGTQKKLNDYAAVILRDKAKFINGGWQNALGVGLAGDGSDIRVIGAWLFDNGSAGIGGKMDDSIVAYCWCKGNNVKVRDGDGAVMGKFTRSNRSSFRFNRIEGGPNAGLWFDNYCGGAEVADNVIRDIRLLDNSKAWTAVGIKSEISLPGWKILRNDIADTGSYCIDVNETFDVEIAENRLEESAPSSDGGVLGLRNLLRSDKPSGLPPHSCELGNVFFHHNRLTKGYGTITGSGAGQKLSLPKFGIRVENNQGEVRYKNISQT